MPARLPILRLHKLAAPINLQAAKNILRPRDPPVIRRRPLVAHMDPPAPASTAARKRPGLALDPRVLHRVCGQHGVEDLVELRVFRAGCWRRRQAGGGADGQRGRGRVGGQEGQDVLLLVGENVL